MTRCFIVALLAASTSSLGVCILSLYCARLAFVSGQQGTNVVGSCKRTSYAQTGHLTMHVNSAVFSVTGDKRHARFSRGSFAFLNSK